MDNVDIIGVGCFSSLHYHSLSFWALAFSVFCVGSVFPMASMWSVIPVVSCARMQHGSKFLEVYCVFILQMSKMSSFYPPYLIEIQKGHNFQLQIVFTQNFEDLVL